MLSISLFVISSIIAQSLPNPIIFCAQVPNPTDFTTLMSTFGNHTTRMSQSPRGGDLYIIYPNGTLKNLTQLAGYGEAGMQGANAIAVRDPHVHWDGTKAIFSMIIGAPTERYQEEVHYWQLYEITGLGISDSPIITKVSNQPTDYNNIAPIYGTDDRIIFESDRPRTGERHLYPQHDEYESTATVTGLWRIDPASCSGINNIEMLTTAPSGDFTPLLDSYGRIVFTRWDHLKRDQQADADILNGSPIYGTFNYTDESAQATKYVGDIEVFPEPLSNRVDLFALPEWQNTNPINVNVFTPWMINEDGKELETLNHLGRHDMGAYFSRNFTNDDNLDDFDGLVEPIRNMFHIKESPVTQGLYFATDAPEFATHASGQIISLYLPAGMSPDSMQLTYLTHPDTRDFTNNPSADHSGLYRNPIPLSDGQIVVSHTYQTDEDDNEGTLTNPISRYAFRLRYLEQNGTYYSSNTPLTNGIVKNVSWYNPDQLINYNGELWETFPVEVRSRPRPVTTTFNTVEVPVIEKDLFEMAGITIADFKRFLKRNKLALLVTRNVTSRDDADRQQPFNLKISNSSTQTIDPNNPNNIYEVKYMQYLQGDLVRGIGGIATPDEGRRTLAQYMHDNNALTYNLPTTGDVGSINLASDGSVAALVPANRAMTWQLTDDDDHPIVRERVWLSFQSGEIRVCTSCHGENDFNQAGLTFPTNAPLALTQLLNHVQLIDTDSDNIVDIYDAFPYDNTRHLGEVITEDFANALSDWINNNPDGDNAHWDATVTSCTDEAVAINNQMALSTGTIDQLIRYIDLSDIIEATLSFDVAYAPFDENTFDELVIKVQSCDNSNSTVIYQKSGSDLATSPNQQSLFVPSDCNQWRGESIDLSAFLGQEFELIFENISGVGNQLFLDNISILEISTSCAESEVVVTTDFIIDTTIIAGSSITATNAILDNTTVIYRSGSTINLMSGFRADVGCEFRAEIGGCEE